MKNGEVMNNAQPSALNDTVKTRKATIGISVGIGDALSQQPRCRGRGKQTIVTKCTKRDYRGVARYTKPEESCRMGYPNTLSTLQVRFRILVHCDLIEIYVKFRN